MNNTKKEAKELGKYVDKIITTLDDFDVIYQAMKEVFTHITDIDAPKFKEYNETYKVDEMARIRQLYRHKNKIRKLKGQEGNYAVITEIIPYEKAPSGFVILVALYNYSVTKTFPICIELYIDERKDKNVTR